MTYTRIQEIASEFTDGTPISEEIKLRSGVIFHFDNPFDEDVEEPYVVATVLVDTDEFDFEPTKGDIFNDVSELDSIDSQLQTDLKQDGFSSVRGPEYDASNSTDKYHNFVYTLTL